jgi:hypothetical protein
MLSLISGGVVVTAIAIVFGQRGVWAASLLFLIGLVMFPFAMIYFLGLTADANRQQARELAVYEWKRHGVHGFVRDRDPTDGDLCRAGHVAYCAAAR